MSGLAMQAVFEAVNHANSAWFLRHAYLNGRSQTHAHILPVGPFLRQQPYGSV
jgi:hypothetical protein